MAHQHLHRRRHRRQHAQTLAVPGRTIRPRRQSGVVRRGCQLRRKAGRHQHQHSAFVAINAIERTPLERRCRVAARMRSPAVYYLSSYDRPRRKKMSLPIRIGRLVSSAKLQVVPARIVLLSSARRLLIAIRFAWAQRRRVDRRRCRWSCNRRRRNRHWRRNHDGTVGPAVFAPSSTGGSLTPGLRPRGSNRAGSAVYQAAIQSAPTGQTATRPP